MDVVDAQTSPAATTTQQPSQRAHATLSGNNEREKIEKIENANPPLIRQAREPSPNAHSACHRRGLTTSVINPPASPAANSPISHPRPSTSPSPTRPSRPSFPTQASSYFRPQSAASGTEARSPANKRPPASRSSHGIETSTGPPPALSTQRTLSTDTVWRLSDSIDSTISRPPLTYEALASLNSFKIDKPSTSSVVKTPNQVHEDPNIISPKDVRKEEQSPVAVTEKMITKEARLDDDRTQAPDEEDLTVRPIQGQHSIDATGKQVIESPKTRENGDRQSLHEDLFLNIAQSDVGSEVADDSISRRERRRSRLGLPRQRYSVPLSNAQLPIIQPPDEQGSNRLEVLERREEMSTNHAHPEQAHNGFQQDLSRDRPFPASVLPLDQRYKTRYSSAASRVSPTASQGVSNYVSSMESPTIYRRRQSIPETSPGYQSRGYKHSNLSYTGPGQYHSSPLTGPPSSINDQDTSLSRRRPEGSESTVSTTAPSTVWDELDDLKSRIRKLELTGKLPMSSGAAISTATGERPQTGNTTITTMSSSPKRLRIASASPDGSTLGGQELAGVHPNLHSALSKSKQAIDPTVYKALEATASDALTLAAMASSGRPGSSQLNPSLPSTSNAVDRHIRLKADSMCRSLTELCLAMSQYLSEREPSSSTTRPEHRNDLNSQQLREQSLGTSRRHVSAQDLDARSTSRVMSRLEARRSSTFGLNGINGVDYERPSSRAADQEPPTPRPMKTATPTPLSRTSTVLVHRRRTDYDDGEGTTRPLSRSMTHSNRAISATRQAGNREYTSHHPLPPSHQRSPSVQSSLPIRRSYFSSETSQPSTPESVPRGRRYLDRSTPPSADSISVSEARQQRVANLSTYTSTGRPRAQSFGRGLRPSRSGLMGRDASVELES